MPLTNGHWTEVARMKLSRIYGEQKAQRLLVETLVELGVQDLSSPDDLALFADRLVAKGGFLCAVGTSLRTHAMLHGARGS